MEVVWICFLIVLLEASVNTTYTLTLIFCIDVNSAVYTWNFYAIYQSFTIKNLLDEGPLHNICQIWYICGGHKVNWARLQGTTWIVDLVRDK